MFNFFTSLVGSEAATTTAEKSKPLQLPWRTRVIVSLASALSDIARRPNGTINRRLLSFLDVKVPHFPTIPFLSVTSVDTIVDPTRNLWFRLYTPTTTIVTDEKLPVLVFFHGGGFSYLSAASFFYDVVCRRFAKALHCIVVSVEYRLAPEFKFPCQYVDGFDVLKFLDENHLKVLPRNADLSKCFLIGDSGGANLAHHVAVRAGRVRFRFVKLVGLVSIQPYFGGEERTKSELRLYDAPLVTMTRTDWCWKALLPDGSDRNHYAVNVSGPEGEDISGLDYPDTIVFVSGFDPLQDWQRRYYKWLKKSGKVASLVEYPNMIHAFYVFPDLPESTQLICQVKEFVANKVSNSGGVRM